MIKTLNNTNTDKGMFQKYTYFHGSQRVIGGISITTCNLEANTVDILLTKKRLFVRKNSSSVVGRINGATSMVDFLRLIESNDS